MAHVARDHLLDQLLADFRVIGRLLPAGQLVQHVQAQLVAGIEEMLIRRIVRHPHGVHVHFLDQPDIGVADLLAQAPPRVRPEAVPADALEPDLLPVQVQPVARPDLERAEAESFRDCVDCLDPPPQTDSHCVEVRCLGRPSLVSPHLPSKCRLPLARGQLRLECFIQHSTVRPDNRRRNGISTAGSVEMNIHAEGSIRTGVHRHPFDELLRHRLQIDRPVDAAEDPVVGPPLGVLDARVGGDLADGDFQEVLAGLDQIGDLVLEPVEPALVFRSGRFAVDRHLGVGHHAVEDEEDALVAPLGRNAEGATVLALLVGLLLVVAVVVVAEALKLPVGRHANRGPFAAVAPGGAIEFPRHRIVLAVTGKVEDLRLLSKCGDAPHQHDQASDPGP